METIIRANIRRVRFFVYGVKPYPNYGKLVRIFHQGVVMNAR